MGVEIERKYTVNKDKWNKITKGEGTSYRQGYLLIDPGKTIRIRHTDEHGFITIKGPSEGISRPEFEYKIPILDAKEIVERFCSSAIVKTRYRVLYNGNVWEVDEFSGDNEGLIIAEIELKSEQQKFDIPDWINQEVTEDEKYYNSWLSKNPYKNWDK